MPFVLKMSQDVFQARIDQTFEGCRRTVGIANDIVIHGKSEEEHDKHMHEIMNRCTSTAQTNARSNRKKIMFYGVICSADGIQSGQSLSFEEDDTPYQQTRTSSIPGISNLHRSFHP